ncbi:uncharacterized protein BKA78DRAFT_327684 [Phyllosticta capitalensis]|uniref:uncharacterized protein n=1 Tax=Phyllosticta capitalensis TaxID=121624 RepID=UPI00312E2C3C
MSVLCRCRMDGVYGGWRLGIGDAAMRVLLQGARGTRRKAGWVKVGMVDEERVSWYRAYAHCMWSYHYQHSNIKSLRQWKMATVMAVATTMQIAIAILHAGAVSASWRLTSSRRCRASTKTKEQ